MNGRDDLDRLVAAVRPWLDELVLVGGWAHRLHHDHPLASRQPYQPVRTRDADLVFNTRAKLSGKISEALAQGGFREDLSTDERPPVAQYVLDTGEDGFFAEFLTPLTGGRTRRDGRGVATVARSGITAQRLRHLEVLLVAPWPVSVGGDGSASLPMKTAIQVAKPTAFLAQKLLCHLERKPEKRSQDILYMHDTVRLFDGHLETLHRIWLDEVLPSLRDRQRKDIEARRHQITADTTDSIRRAARIPADRQVRPDELRHVLVRGLEEIFSS